MAVLSSAASDVRIAPALPLLVARFREMAALAAGSLGTFLDGTLENVAREGLRLSGAHEGTIWLIDETRTALIPCFNSGPRAAEFVGIYRQDLRQGMISMVIATEQPICENSVQYDRRQDKTLDERLGVQTCALAAVPLYFAGDLRGVLSGVQLGPAGAATNECRGFQPDSLLRLQLTATLLARLIEHRIWAQVLGLESGE